MATKKPKKEKPKPPIRLFGGGELFHACTYEGAGSVTTTYHNDEVRQKLEPRWSERLSEAARTIIAENPSASLLDI